MSYEYLYGLQPVLHALQSGRRKFFGAALSVSDRRPELEPILATLKRKRIEIVETDRERLRRACGSDQHQGIILKASHFEWTPYEQVAHKLQQNQTNGLVLLLDQIQDPHNLGAILRSALVFGVDMVILPEHQSAPISPTVVKTSAGATEYLPLVRVPNLVRNMQELKELGYWIYGATEHGQTIYTQQKFEGRIALVLGNEGSGLRRLVRETCDIEMAIPASGPIVSLNVSVAAGVLLGEITRQRNLSVA